MSRDQVILTILLDIEGRICACTGRKGLDIFTVELKILLEVEEGKCICEGGYGPRVHQIQNPVLSKFEAGRSLYDICRRNATPAAIEGDDRSDKSPTSPTFDFGDGSPKPIAHERTPVEISRVDVVDGSPKPIAHERTPVEISRVQTIRGCTIDLCNAVLKDIPKYPIKDLREQRAGHSNVGAERQERGDTPRPSSSTEQRVQELRLQPSLVSSEPVTRSSSPSKAGSDDSAGSDYGSRKNKRNLSVLTEAVMMIQEKRRRLS
jgi:hypothetical protein